jgi:hypothetical protein
MLISVVGSGWRPCGSSTTRGRAGGRNRTGRGGPRGARASGRRRAWVVRSSARTGVLGARTPGGSSERALSGPRFRLLASGGADFPRIVPGPVLAPSRDGAARPAAHPPRRAARARRKGPRSPLAPARPTSASVPPLTPRRGESFRSRAIRCAAGTADDAERGADRAAAAEPAQRVPPPGPLLPLAAPGRSSRGRSTADPLSRGPPGLRPLAMARPARRAERGRAPRWDPPGRPATVGDADRGSRRSGARPPPWRGRWRPPAEPGVGCGAAGGGPRPGLAGRPPGADPDPPSPPEKSRFRAAGVLRAIRGSGTPPGKREARHRPSSLDGPRPKMANRAWPARRSTRLPCAKDRPGAGQKVNSRKEPGREGRGRPGSG